MITALIMQGQEVVHMYAHTREHYLQRVFLRCDLSLNTYRVCPNA